jgi:AcrR family transcriptional regulator
MTEKKGRTAKEKKVRLSSADRRAQILSAAITFFSEEGFDGSTRMLAQRLGITQPLIYRYFPTKESLVQEVYQAVFAGRWRNEWEAILRDRSVPLRTRIRDFYLRYTGVVFGRDWMRIYLFSGLRGLEINRWWSSFVEENVLRLVGDELRHEHGLPSVDERPLSPDEIETLWNFQGCLFYFAVRRDIYRAKVHMDFSSYIDSAIRSLLASYAALVQETGDHPAARKVRRKPVALRA